MEKKEVMNYSEYKSYCNEWGLKKEYSDISKNYIVFFYVAYGSPNLEARLAAVDYNGNNVDLYIWDDASGVTADISAYCIVIPTEKEINNNMPLEINPNPDTIIRVLMTFKGLESPIEVEEQKLDTPERKGFVVVEWGGTEIK